MSRSGKIEIEWADCQGAGSNGRHVFRLPIAQLEELQEKCDAGPQQIMRRIYDGTWRVRDITETIRLGLIGGGMPPVDAAKLTSRYVTDGALSENVMTAQVIIMAALAGVPDEPLKKKRNRNRTAAPANPTTDANSSNSPPFTNSEPH